MREQVPCDFPPGYDGRAMLDRLAAVLDPELDESILDLGFVRALTLDGRDACVDLQLPTAWCAVNFAFLMAQDVREAVLAAPGVGRVTVRLGDHCAAAAIEAAVNGGRSFADAFPGEGAASLAALRRVFLHKGFLGRQERVVRELRGAGLSLAAISCLRLGEVSAVGGDIRVRPAGGPPVTGGAAQSLRRYLERRAELGLDCGAAAPLIIDLEGRPVSAAGLQAHYESARSIRVAMEANGSFCRTLLAARRDPPHPAGPADA